MKFNHPSPFNINFDSKLVIVTGATRGIGASIVKLFQDCNAQVIATGTNQNEIDRMNDNAENNRIKYLHLDFSIEESINRFLHQINKIDRVDVLVNNAGVNRIDTIDQIKVEDWDLINKVNLRGPLLVTRDISKTMQKARSGKIVNISSVFGVVSKTKRASYSATKSGLIGFTKAVALDLAPYNILVNSVSPGFVDTQLTRKILGNSGIKKIKKTIPQNRLARVKEIAKIVLFLSSDHNSYITGQNIIVDGGFTSA